MKRLILAAAAILLSSPAVAEDPDQMPWRRIQTGYGTVWVLSSDLASARASPSQTPRLTLLDPDPAQPADASEIRYAIHRQVYDCRSGAARESIQTYRAVGRPAPEFSTPEVEIAPDVVDPVLFGIVCRGARADGVEVNSINAALNSG